MLANMLEAEDRLESENMSVTSTGMITDKKYTTSDRDIMRLYQCRKEQVIPKFCNPTFSQQASGNINLLEQVYSL